MRKRTMITCAPVDGYKTVSKRINDYRMSYT